MAQWKHTESGGGLEQQERTEPKTSSIRDPQGNWPWPSRHSHLKSPELSSFVNTVVPDVLLEWTSHWRPSANAPGLANSLTLLSSSLTTQVPAPDWVPNTTPSLCSLFYLLFPTSPCPSPPSYPLSPVSGHQGLVLTHPSVHPWPN